MSIWRNGRTSRRPGSIPRDYCPRDYPLTLTELCRSLLVHGDGGSPNWDRQWRLHLVENLAVLAKQLWSVGIEEIFVDGSFAEDKDHPNDIDGYFCCELGRLASGELERDLNHLDPHQAWTWDPATRRPYRGYPKRQLPMWHVYRVELYPHYGQLCGIRDEFGNELEFPAAFRTSAGDKSAQGNHSINEGGGRKMIRSEAEYQEAVKRLADEQARLKAQRGELKKLDLSQAEIKRAMDPLQSFHEQLKEEVESYNRLQRGDFDEVTNFEGMGRLLIALRISQGLTQRELADRLEVHESTVSRDERNEYHGITVERASRVLAALGVTLRTQVASADALKTA